MKGEGKQGEKDRDTSQVHLNKQRSCFQALWKSRFYLEGVYKEGQGKKHNTSLQRSLRQQCGQPRDLAAHSLPLTARSASTLQVCSKVPPDLLGPAPPSRTPADFSELFRGQIKAAPRKKPNLTSYLHFPKPIPVGLSSIQYQANCFMTVEANESSNNPWKWTAFSELFSCFL